ncbi:Phosphoribosylaminoimidazole-succinocarboxamide synthase [Gammaproteobacteria bacterium]
MPLFQSTIKTLPLIHRGKVRDLYAVGQDHLLIVTTDRLSAFDVVLPTPIPEKGAILTALSHFWFRKLNFANHLSDRTLEEVLPDPVERAEVLGRSTVARRFRALPVEAIVRGYLAGSGWKDYQKTGQVCGVPLPLGLREADRLPEPIFTPSTKAAVGDHDENISFQQTVALIGSGLAHKLREAALSLYQEAAEYALARGILIADTKFEFGISEEGQLILIDEALTPDSSRFWPLDQYGPGKSPPSFDKQYVRDYLESCQWDKKPPAPELPTEVVARTTEKYREALRRLIQV